MVSGLAVWRQERCHNLPPGNLAQSPSLYPLGISSMLPCYDFPSHGVRKSPLTDNVSHSGLVSSRISKSGRCCLSPAALLLLQIKCVHGHASRVRRSPVNDAQLIEERKVKCECGTEPATHGKVCVNGTSV